MAERAPVLLADYRPPGWEVLSIRLEFALDADLTQLVATTHFRALVTPPPPLQLDGDGLDVLQVEIDGMPLVAGEADPAATISPDGLHLPNPPAEFRLRTVTRLRPAANKALSGLYLSGGRLCTQCEAEGFRRLTFALDRPDVMTVYSVRLVADRARFPTLLSNGNPGDHGELGDGRHFAEWHDPHKKPTYLFAVAAGAYECVRGEFTTCSGRRIDLAVYVDPGEGSRAHYALDCLQRAMRWDEEVHQREYDLGVYNIVAVRDFNFGAMENKGLNLFNSAYVLADPATATDSDYEGIESVIAHEYFHNWTGNRITLRDWFQLSLKEGLTVFRDQEFSADQRSRAVQRIKDVRQLRLRQFVEDQGPLAHAVRPASYHAIDNFYTATVYEKGAEVIRMLQFALGNEGFAAGLQRYYTDRDGTAATVEDLLASLQAATGTDLAPFLRWYEQAGTPQVRVRCLYDAATATCSLQLAQHTPPTPGQSDKQPLPIPLRIGFLGPDGSELASMLDEDSEARTEHRVLLHTATATLRFRELAAEPVPSVLRGFCAPVELDDGLSPAARAVQMAHDPDPCTRWQAAQQLAREALQLHADGVTQWLELATRLAEGLQHELARATADAAFRALMLRLPDLGEFVQLRSDAHPPRLRLLHRELQQLVARHLEPQLRAIASAAPPAADDIAAEAAGIRALRGAALELLASLGQPAWELLAACYRGALSMTEQLAALTALGQAQAPQFAAALADFYQRHRQHNLVLDKWFAVQATTYSDAALATVRALYQQHPDFDRNNPNRIRALVGNFANRNVAAFHREDGAGYAFLAEVVTALDPHNPTLAARLLQPFAGWRRLVPPLQAAVQRELAGLQALTTLSKNTREMLDRTLA